MRGGFADARPTALKHTMELFQRKNTCTSVDVDNPMAGSTGWGTGTGAQEGPGFEVHL